MPARAYFTTRVAFQVVPLGRVLLMVAVPGCAPTKTPGVTPTGGVSTPELPYPTTDVSSILI